MWWDRKIPTGRRFYKVIEHELTAARCVIALWSKAASNSSWVREEAQDGLDRDILVPARIETIPLPIGFRTVQTADLTDWNGNPAHLGFMQLVQDIATALGAAAPEAAQRPPVVGATAASARPLRVFYSYAHKDEELRDELANHLSLLKRQGLILPWHDRNIMAGEEWRGKIDAALERADIVLLLVSADFLASDYCYDVEMHRALERHANGEARVIPIILRDCSWTGAPFGKLQALPKNGKAVKSWPNRDRAWREVEQGLVEVANELQMRRRWPPPSTATSTRWRSKVFISYSHADKKWLERLKRHLKPLVREGCLDCWDDTHIRPGDDWRKSAPLSIRHKPRCF